MFKRTLCAAGLAAALFVAAPGAAFANDSVARHGGHGSCRHGQHHDGRHHRGDHDGRDHDGLLGGLFHRHHHRDSTNADWDVNRRCG